MRFNRIAWLKAKFALGTVLVLSMGSAVVASEYRFTILAETGMSVPDGTGGFTSFAEPAVHGVDTVFFGRNAWFRGGIYHVDASGVTVVADRNTPVPWRPNAGWIGFDTDLSLENGCVAFEGFLLDGYTTGEAIVTAYQGQLQRHADTFETTVPPDHADVFARIDEPALVGSTVIFRGTRDGDDDDAGNSGIFHDRLGLLTREVSAGEESPETAFGRILSVDNDLSADGASVAFEARVEIESEAVDVIVVSTNGALMPVVTGGTTMVPGGQDVFDRLEEPSLDNGAVAFGATTATGESGIYTTLGGTLRRVADTSTFVPGRPGVVFENFDLKDPAMHEGLIVFTGSSADGVGLYAEIQGTLVEILHEGQPLVPGKTIRNLQVGYDRAVHAGRIGFLASFIDGSQAVVLGTPVPEPLTVGVLAIVLPWVCRRRPCRSAA